MKLRNISISKYEFSILKEGEKKPFQIAVLPGCEIEIDESHPESMKKLAEQYPKDWVEVTEKKKTKEELKAELAAREAEEKADAEKAAKAEKKADADKKAKEKSA